MKEIEDISTNNQSFDTGLSGESEAIMANQFIKLTSRSGRPTLVNINNVTNMIDNIDDTVIYLTSGMSVDVKEDLATITQIILGEVEFKAEADTVVTSTNVPASGRVLVDLKSLMDDVFRYDTDTERDVKLIGDSVYLICSRYSSAKLKMASNIRDNKPVFEGCESDGWVYYARISAGQIVESDGISVPASRDQKIREVFTALLEMYK